MNQMGGVQFSSWVNETLPEMLWAALLLNKLPRSDCIQKFRIMLAVVEQHKGSFDKQALIHSDLAELTDELFDLLFVDLCKENDASKALRPLLLIECLPGRDRWSKYLKPTEDGDGEVLAAAIAASYDHQSVRATDSRWLRVMTENAKGRFLIAENVQGYFEDVLNYPDHKEPGKAAATVRALEMSTRGHIEGAAPKPFAEAFWREVWEHSECMLAKQDQHDVPDHKDLVGKVHAVYEELIQHYRASISTTLVDARHEGAFGLVFYIMHMCILALKATVGQTVQGRLALRGCVEALITLKFLATKDDATIWLQYRNYGAGQSKLAYLKYNESDPPAFISRELLENMANADVWMEHLDIKLGAWADKNLRQMAIDAGAKDLYDKYYDSLSGYIHGNWSAVSHSTFQVCVNPLHRFHQIPVPPRFFIEDAVPDLVALTNLALDQLASLYAPFKARVKAL
jgi:hypothetical protein